jgi:hypothetical protein
VRLLVPDCQCRCVGMVGHCSESIRLGEHDEAVVYCPCDNYGRIVFNILGLRVPRCAAPLFFYIIAIRKQEIPTSNRSVRQEY